VFVPVYYLFGGGVAWVMDKSVLLCLVLMAALLVWRHSANLSRLVQGTESKLGQKKA
jgi:acyl phosphate:glycerol-3-phosphate acyltransferase